jgi:hypothetical protein
MIRDSIGALHCGEAGSEAIEYVTVLEPSLTGRRGPELQDV